MLFILPQDADSHISACFELHKTGSVHKSSCENWVRPLTCGSSNICSVEVPARALSLSPSRSPVVLPKMEIAERSMDPPKIHRLEDSVINRIAAGEVIQRPVSAVKELIENSIDAASSSINVVVKDGGLKLIQVSDDGHGIRYEDLPILCERHTTSKLSVFEDLQTIKSMGFRGEALASMAYVAHVTVTTITKGQLHGYRVSYRDGVMVHEPKPCAAVKGTQIMVENLFYNMMARKKTLQNSSDDYTKIVDVISRFAVHHINISFSCKKHGAARADVHSVATSSKVDAIKSIYGVFVARDLMEVTTSGEDPSSSSFKMQGLISNSNYSAKKMTMILYINVHCLKRAIEVVYAATLPKASKPFVYMSITLPPEHVDVNVHPTKREVSLLNQESIIENIQSTIESMLRSSNSTRTFHTQVGHVSPSSLIGVIEDANLTNSTPVATKSQKVPVHKMVRTDSMDPAGRMHAYLQDNPLRMQEKKADLTSVRSAIRQRRNPKEAADLSSVHELVNEIDSSCHSGLLDIVKHCTYVGMADDVLALLQYNTLLYLVNVVNLSKELMYQQALRRFAHFNAIQLSDPAPLSELIMMALREEDMESGSSDNDDLKEKIVEIVPWVLSCATMMFFWKTLMNTELLKQKAELLDEYFCIHIDQQGNLSRLPVILDQYTPNMDHVPEFALCLGNDVDWEDEKNCFQTIAASLGNFYAMHPPLLPNPESEEGLRFYKKIKLPGTSEDPGKESNDLEDDEDHELCSEAKTAWDQRDWCIQHVLFPSMRLFLKPPKSMATNGTFVQIARELRQEDLPPRLEGDWDHLWKLNIPSISEALLCLCKKENETLEHISSGVGDAKTELLMRWLLLMRRYMCLGSGETNVVVEHGMTTRDDNMARQLAPLVTGSVAPLWSRTTPSVSSPHVRVTWGEDTDGVVRLQRGATLPVTSGASWRALRSGPGRYIHIFIEDALN
ncbi:hypothetical protein Sjap_021398 [Stephania japonica]|uniref:DNA mismatch repair protein S5 domain-containing protein n=1 Tax=Stephania japonica TaxID=461633 RepID=A0AAP0ELW9_9MAGN